MRPRWGGWLGLLNPNGLSISYIGHEQKKIGFAEPFADAGLVGGECCGIEMASAYRLAFSQ